MKKLYASRVLGCLLAAGAWLLGTPSQAQVAIDKTNWNIVFQDEFDDPSTLGPNSTKWSNGYSFGSETPVLGSNLHYSTWNNIVMHDGVADFVVRDISGAPIYFNGTRYDYTSGAITCKFNDIAYSNCVANGSSVGDRGFLYGMFEIKCRMPRGGGQLAAFWLYGAVETDIFEYNGIRPAEFTSTQQPLPGQLSQACTTTSTKVSPSDLTDDYHVYTLVWTPTSMTYFLDGREVRTDTDPNRIPTGCHWRRMMPCIDAEVWYTPDATNSPFSVDYVRVYKPAGNDYTLPYKASAAINTINCLNWNVQATSKRQDACYSRSSVPTRDIDVNPSQQVFFRTDQSTLMQLAFDPGSGSWVPNLLDPTTTNVTANVTCSKNAPNVFYSDPGGYMWNLYNYNGWHSACLDWSVNDVSNNVVASPTNLYYRTTSGGLSYFWFDNAGWHHTSVPQANSISSCQGSIAVVDDYVFYKTYDNRLYYVQSAPTGWSNAVQIGAATNVGSSLAIEVFPNRSGLVAYKVYYIGTDNAVYNAYLENGQWVSYGLDWRVTNAASDLIVAGSQIFYKGTDARLWNYYYYEGGWRLSPINYDTTPAVRGGLVAGNDGRVFFVDANRYIYNAYATPSHLVNLPCGRSANVSNRQAQSPLAAAGSRPAAKAAAVQMVVYDICGRKILAGANPANPITRQGLGLAPGFYVLHYLDAAGQVVRTEKTVFAE